MGECSIEEIMEEVKQRNKLIHHVAMEGLILHARELTLNTCLFILREISEREDIDWREILKEVLRSCMFIENLEVKENKKKTRFKEFNRNERLVLYSALQAKWTSITNIREREKAQGCPLSSITIEENLWNELYQENMES